MEKPFREIIDLSGLPEQDANQFLSKAFEARGLDYSLNRLEDLRSVLEDLLQDLILATDEH